MIFFIMSSENKFVKNKEEFIMTIQCPMPGKVVSVEVSVGQSVKAGDTTQTGDAIAEL